MTRYSTGNTLAGHQYVTPSSAVPSSPASFPKLSTFTHASVPSLVKDQGSSSTVLPPRVATEAVRRRADTDMDGCDEGRAVSVLAERGRGGGGGMVDGSVSSVDESPISLSSDNEEVDETEAALFRFVELGGAFDFPSLGIVRGGFFAEKARAVPPAFFSPDDFPRNGLCKPSRSLASVSSSDSRMGLSARPPLALSPGEDTSALRLARGRFITLFPLPSESSEDLVGELGARLLRPYVTLTGVLGLEGSPNSRTRVSDGGGELSSCAAANFAAFLAAARGGILHRRGLLPRRGE